MDFLTLKYKYKKPNLRRANLAAMSSIDVINQCDVDDCGLEFWLLSWLILLL
jgi:hypothetical protein